MIKDIVELFYNLSKEHKLVRGFEYNSISKGQGTGDELHPLVFLETPIYIGNADTVSGSIPVTINFEVLITPQMLENWHIPQPSTEAGQNICHSIALNFVAKIRDISLNDDYSYGVISVVSYSFMTLKDYYDNDCDGVRCTLVLNMRNDINYCDMDEHFDPNKEFDMSKLLPDIDTDNASGCADFSYKLPEIKL